MSFYIAVYFTVYFENFVYMSTLFLSPCVSFSKGSKDFTRLTKEVSSTKQVYNPDLNVTS